MNLDKAIELLQRDLDDPGSVDILDLNEAQALSIEALKDHLTAREEGWLPPGYTLPGETE